MLILRVDDRLIHGQVIAGWARPLGIDCVILASDRLSRDEWSCNAYRLAVPEGIEFSCYTIQECVNYLNSTNRKRKMVIVESVSEASQLVRNGLTVPEVNVGGLGYHEGTREIAPYIYLSAADIESVVYLHNLGIKITGKQLPNSVPVDVVKKLAGIK
ncbi:MAG: PTS sugar transporter subunit IIB [candidate division WOR-3 bacterium]|nr:MAG: PTS sugar transporter subunit IIB [candidate division WOR-3 bacterium]